MSETDNGTSEAPEPTVEPAEKPKVYTSSSKPSFKKAPSHKAEVIPDHLSDDIIVKIRASLQEDHGVAGMDMPTNTAATIKPLIKLTSAPAASLIIAAAFFIVFLLFVFVYFSN